MVNRKPATNQFINVTMRKKYPGRPLLLLVPGLIAARGLAFALNVDDPAKRNISLAMLRLRDKGFLSSLERKWWEERSECPKEDQSSKSNKL